MPAPSPLYRRAARDSLERQQVKLLELRDRLWNDALEALRLEFGSDDENLSNAGRATFFSLIDGPVAEVNGALDDLECDHGLDYPKRDFSRDEFIRIERLKELLA